MKKKIDTKRLTKKQQYQAQKEAKKRNIDEVKDEKEFSKMLFDLFSGV